MSEVHWKNCEMDRPCSSTNMGSKSIRLGSWWIRSKGTESATCLWLVVRRLALRSGIADLTAQTVGPYEEIVELVHVNVQQSYFLEDGAL